MKDKHSKQKSVAKMLKKKLVDDMKITLKRLIYNENTKRHNNNNNNNGHNWRNIGSQYFIPVSYTHLDVYKRQVWQC